ncbi:MAG: Nif3-like dinuclear metal center hexameric protein [Clostridia bacterium]|nr:Nif3-like dinuclear metal center hexameric protein [Clostridia bacterium]
MVTVREIERLLTEKIPYDLAWEWDNVGLLVGNPDSEVKNIMFSVDITESVINEAKTNDCSLIISHHPVIFNGIKQIRKDDYATSKIYSLIENNISAICLHTNLDNIENGMCDSLCTACKISVDKVLEIEGKPCLRVGKSYAGLSASDFAEFVKKSISANGVMFFDSGRKVEKIAVVTGSGGSCIHDAYLEGCDTVLTGELKHNNFIDAKEMGINLICAGHYFTEKGGLKLVKSVIANEYPSITFVYAKSLDDLYKFI